MLKKNIKMSILAGTFFPFLHFMSNLGVALVLYFGGKEAISGQVSTGDFIAFISYMAMLTWPLMAMGMIIGFIQQGLASLNRLNRVFTAEEIASVGKVDIPLTTKPNIEIKNLTFTYPKRTIPAISGITLKLPHDQITALIGPMGAGKSTLAALLPALHKPPSGTIMVGNVAAENWPLDSLRALFGYVPQDGFLFSGTIFDNLAFGKPKASEAEILAAAAAAGLMGDIATFPLGLQTTVGERGLTLSGGQRQRLALARALVINPPFLLMDDTLSAVDAHVEDTIMGNLLSLRKGRGTLIISHRLTSLLGVDRIVVMEKGRISDEGSPKELLGRESYFKRVFELGKF
ncbi:MAG: ABC transporter ATP-binding protein [Candidatus Adiutrix sp.]